MCRSFAACAAVTCCISALFCSRDRFGVKPFYHVQRDSSFAFASEIKALFHSGLIEPRLDRRGASVLVRHDVDSGRARILLHTPHSAADTVDLAGVRCAHDLHQQLITRRLI